jgi:DNA-binding Xre family transcriptional regulator
MLSTKELLVKNLNIIIEELKINKNILSISLGIDYVTLYRWLNGSRAISFDYLDKITLKLNMKPLDLINPKLKVSTKTKIYIEGKNLKISVY